MPMMIYSQRRWHLRLSDMADNAGISDLPFDVSGEVAKLVGLQELRTLARIANAEPFECLSCERQRIAQARPPRPQWWSRSSGRPPGQERMMLRLAHRSCLLSQILVVNENDVTLQSESNVTVVRALLRGPDGPRPVLCSIFWTSLTDPGAGPDGGTDILVSGQASFMLAWPSSQILTRLYPALPVSRRGSGARRSASGASAEYRC